jgi:tRNA-dihydrouridine synthase B
MIPAVSLLPWTPPLRPLMLAPMQGLTNRALRAVVEEWVRPDVVWTEFVRGRPGPEVVSRVDQRELASRGRVPLVVQLIGNDRGGLQAAAAGAHEAGAAHLNFNLGCPSRRHGGRGAGGALLAMPERLPALLGALREAFPGSLSVKLRAGYDDPRQVFTLLPLFEQVGVDYLVLHPRTVLQEFAGHADHRVTAEVVEATRLPVIANGDVTSVAQGRRVLEETGAAGLMLGRGAMADPVLFQRLRGAAPPEPDGTELRQLLERLLPRYVELFCGDHQVLAKLKEPLRYATALHHRDVLARLRRARTLAAFQEALQAL